MEKLDDSHDDWKQEPNPTYVYTQEDEEKEEYNEMLAEWKIEDKEIESTRKVRELNTKLVNKVKVKNMLKELNAQIKSMEESIEAQDDLVVQLDAAIGRGKGEVLRRRKEIEYLKEQIRLQNQEYNATHRLFQLEMSGLKRLPMWWFLLVLAHIVLAYTFVTKSRLMMGIVHFFMFLLHYRGLYVKTSGVYTLMSLCVFTVEVFFLAKSFN